MQDKMANENDLHLDPIITKLLCLSDVMLSLGHINLNISRLLALRLCLHVMYRNQTYFPFPLTDRVCHQQGLSLWVPFQNAATAVTNLYKGNQVALLSILVSLSRMYWCATYHSYSCFCALLYQYAL